MKMSRTTLKELKARYLQILKKCAYLNAVVVTGICLSGGAQAVTPVTTDAELQNALDAGQTVSIAQGLDLTLNADGKTYGSQTETLISNNGILSVNGTVTFEDNGRDSFGGAIENNNSIAFNDKAVFQNNTALEGGAIRSFGTIHFADTEFIGNSSTECGGGAIMNSGQMIFDGSAEFTDNIAAEWGGALHNYGTVAFNQGSSFNRNVSFYNTVNGAGSEGGAVYNGGEITFSGATNFTDNIVGASGSTSQAGGAVFNSSSRGLTFNGETTFTQNGVNNCGGDFNLQGGAVYNEQGEIKFMDQTTFDQNGLVQLNGQFKNSQIIGGAIYNSTNGTITFNSNAIFKDNGVAKTVSLPSESGVRVDGGAIYNYNGTINFASAVFTGNTAQGAGGAIYNYRPDAQITFSEKALFEGNTANFGGALYSAENSQITFTSDAVFTNNSAQKEAGAIDNAGLLTFAGASFTGNTVTGGDTGAAISNRQSGEITFQDNVTFTNNGSISNNENIIFNGGKIIFDGESSFSENKSTAIYSDDGSITFNGIASFVNNNSAVSNSGVSQITFKNTVTFENQSSGSAVSNQQAGYISFTDKATFQNNAQGAVRNDAKIDFASAEFIGNTSERNGGAVYNGDEITFGSDFTFAANEASTGKDIYNAGRVHLTGDEGTVGTFEGGIAGNGMISKMGSGTIIFGDGMDNSQYNGTIGVWGGSLIGKSESFETASLVDVGAGGIVKTHGESMDYNAQVCGGAMIAHYATSGETQEVSNRISFLGDGNTLLFGAYTAAEQEAERALVGEKMITYTDASGVEHSYKVADKLFTDSTVERAKYQLNEGLGNEYQNTIAFRDSDVLLNGTSYTGLTVYDFDATDTLVISNGNVGDSISFDHLSGTGAKLSFDVSFEESGNGLTLKSDTLTVNNALENGSDYVFKLGQISLAGDKIAEDGLNTKYQTNVLNGNAVFEEGAASPRKIATLIYEYELKAAQNETSGKLQDIEATATGITDGESLKEINQYAGNSALQMGIGNPSVPVTYEVTADLGETGSGEKLLTGADGTAENSIVDAGGHTLFELVKEDTSLKVEKVTIENAASVLTAEAGQATLANVIVKESTGETAVSNGSRLNIMDSTFEETAGAIENKTAGTLTATNSTFGNSLTNAGEAILTDTVLAGTVTNELGGSLTASKGEMSGNVTNAGNLVLNGTGLTASGQILNSGTAEFQGVTANGAIENVSGAQLTASDSTFTTDLTNAGEVLLTGKTQLSAVENTGSVTMNGGEAYLNADITGSGTLSMNNVKLYAQDGQRIANTVVSNGLEIADNGVKNLTFGNLEIVDGTTLDIRNIHVTADTLSVGKASTLAVTLNGLSDFGALHANQVISGEEAGVRFTLAPDFELGTYDVFGSANGYSALNVLHNNVYNVTDLGDGRYLFEEKTQEEIETSVGANTNEAAAIEALLKGEGSNESFNQMQAQISENLQSADPKAVSAAVKAVNGIGGDVNPLIESISTEHFKHVYSAVEEQEGAVGTGAGKGRSGGMEPGRLKVWAKGFYDRTRYTGDSGFRVRSEGGALGVESALTDEVTAGVGYAYGYSVGKEDIRRTEVNTNTGFIHGKYQPGKWYIKGLFSYSRSEYEEDKYILSNYAKATYDVDTIGIQGMTGYELNYKGLYVTPEAGLRYLDIHQESYEDSLGTRVGKNHYSYLTGLMGVKAKMSYKVAEDMKVNPKGGVMFGYDIKRDDIRGVNILSNGAGYINEGKALPRFSATVTGGVEAQIKSNLSISADYMGTLRKDYTDHAGMIKLKYNF